MKKLNILFVLVFLITVSYSGYGQITSAKSGNWSDPATWVGESVPTSSDDVIIGAGHTVTVDAEGSCKNISFGDASSRLGLNANLKIYGNFNRFDTSVNPFYSGSNLWSAGAKMIFTGTAETQTINNLGTTSDPYPLRFQELVIDKSSGKFTTNITGTGTDVKIGIGTSLEIIDGTFELATSDDIEGRNTSGTATTPTIIVRTNGVFDMKGSTSHIRRGNFTGEETAKIGTMTVYGEVNLAASSSNRINIGNIEVMNGGTLKIPYLSEGNMGASRFNPGIITVKSGGVFSNNLTTNYWYTNTTVPASLIVESGGEYYTGSSTTSLAPVTNVDGDIRFARGGDQTIPAALGTVGGTLIFSGSGVKTLSGNLLVNGGLSLRGTATFGLGGFTLTYGPDATLSYGASGQATAQITSNEEWPAVNGPVNVQTYNSGGVTLHDNRTITGILTTTLGSFDNNGSSDDKNLTLGNDATISRARGSLTDVPVFGSSVNLRYTSSLENVTTGYEMPAVPTVLKDLNISSSQGMTLGADVTVNGTFTLGGGGVFLNGHTITYGTVVGSGGTLKETQVLNSPAAVNLGNLGAIITSGANLGSTTIEGGFNAQTNGVNTGILKWYQITPTTNTGLNATLVFSYNEGDELNGIPEANLRLFKSTDEGTTWTLEGGTVDPDANTVTLTGIDGFSRWTLASVSAPLPVELISFTAGVKGKTVELRWKTEGEVNSYLFEIERAGENSGWEKAGEVRASGNSNSAKEYFFIDQNINEKKCRYRLRMVDNDGTYQYSDEVEVNIDKPKNFSLFQNYPNPFNPSTTIKYQIAEKSLVKLAIFDILGNEVGNLINEEKEAGYYSLSFNATGKNFSTGTYFYRMTITGLETGKVSSEVKKMQLIK